MTRAIRCVVAFLIAWSLQSGVSFAEMDWWDHASGPGPFTGLFVDYRFACFAKEDTKTYMVWLDPHDPTALPSLWHRKLPANPTATSTPQQAASDHCKRDEHVRGYLILTERINFNWPGHRNRLVPADNDPKCTPIADCDDLRPVRVWSHEIGYIERLPRGWGIGAIAGLNRLAGPAFNPFYRVSLIPTIEFDPDAVRDHGPHSHWMKIMFGPTIFFKGFTTSDFCNRPGFSCQILKPWKSNNPDIIPMRISVVFDWGQRGPL